MIRMLFAVVCFLYIVSANCAFASGYSMNVPLPGETMGNAKLQYDTLPTVFLAVKTKATRCQTMKVTNTTVTKQPYNLKYKNQQVVAGVWEELWTVKACSKNYNVPVKFILDSKGASFVVSPENITIE